MSNRRVPVDLLLLLVVLLWAVNYSVVKTAIGNLAPLAFNSLRLTGSSILLVGLLYFVKKDGLSGVPWRDWARFVALGLIGHTVYQLCFILGLDSTTVSHSSLLLGTTPVLVALLSALVTSERPNLRAWTGIALSLAGVYLIIGRAQETQASLRGDLLTLAATLCWSLYTVASGPLLSRHGPLKVTATTMALGTIAFLPFGAPSLGKTAFEDVPTATWLGLAFSAVFALGVCYYLWYYAVARIGATRTAIYSNLTPVAAVLISMLAFGERITGKQGLGAVAIFLGVYLANRDRRRA